MLVALFSQSVAFADPMTPEQLARQEIDKQLEAAGWIVQAYRDLHITAGLGVAVREFPLKTGKADCFASAGSGILSRDRYSPPKEGKDDTFTSPI